MGLKTINWRANFEVESNARESERAQPKSSLQLTAVVSSANQII